MKKTLAAIVLAAMVSSTACAQPAAHVSLGAGVSFHDYRSTHLSSGNPSFGPDYHLGLASNHRRQGLSFGFKGGISYSRPDRSEPIGGVATRTGELRALALMAGVGPTYRTGPFSIGMNVLAGPSFNHFEVDDAARTAYRDRYGVTLNSIGVKSSIAVRSGVGLWYNFTDRVGLHSSVSYTVNRPVVTATFNGVTNTSRWMLDRWSYQAGLAVGLF